ncbi:MAG TPA: archease [bacterium]|jgi:SHS2 domain-containing protein
MTPFEIFEHTADVGIEARGASLRELFASAAEGMLSLLISPAAVQVRERRRVVVDADDLEGLLVDWLNELLVLLNADGFLPARFDVQDITERSLRAEIGGEPVDPSRHHFRLDVKAATYHQLHVGRNSEWRARVILDV